jgi:hypothetical protein
MTALDIVQTLELGKKTAHVVLQYSDGRNGDLNVRSGDLRGAVCGNLLGEEAFYLLVRPGDGLFRIEYKKSTTPENITKPNTFLMIEAMRRLDESERDKSASKPDMPSPLALMKERRSLLSAVDPIAPQTPLGRRDPSQSLIDAPSIALAVPPPKVRAPSRASPIGSSLNLPPMPPPLAKAISNRDTRHPSFDEDSPGVTTGDSDRMPRPRSLQAPQSSPTNPPLQQAAGQPMRTLPRDYVPPNVHDQYLEPSIPPPSEEPTIQTRLPSGVYAALASRSPQPPPLPPSTEWDDGVAGWGAAVATPNPALKAAVKKIVSVPTADTEPTLPKFHTLTGDLVLEQSGDIHPDPRLALMSNAGTEVGREPPDAKTEQDAVVPGRLREEDSEGPTKIGRIPIRRVTSFVERVERGVVDPAADDQEPTRSGND